MDQNYTNNPSTAQNSKVPHTQRAQCRNPIMRIAVGIILIFVLAVAAYSIYVAVHEPDPQETVVLGQTKLAAGSPASLRIVVRNRVSGKPIKGADVELSLRSKATNVKLGSFHPDVTGSLGDSIDIPEMPPGQYELILDSKSSFGRDHVVKKVEVQHPSRVFLSSDKPIYQPGQTIHLRSLTVNGRTQIG